MIDQRTFIIGGLLAFAVGYLPVQAYGAVAAATVAADDDDDDDEDEEEEEDAAPAATPAAAAAAASEPAVVVEAAPDEAGAAKIGVVHKNLQRAKQQQSLYGKISEFYSDYSAFKDDTADQTGLSWTMPVSYRVRWQSPGDVSQMDQTLFWPTLNWDMFDSDQYGSGSLQVLYFGERRSGGTVSEQFRGRTVTSEFPSNKDGVTQLSYTHTLPGNKFAVTVGQYVILNFDNNQYMADQQQNFVNNVFSENPSAGYPGSGVGAYAQYNVTKRLQFVAGFQKPTDSSDATVFNQGSSDRQNAWFGYVQWTPKIKGLSDAQYSLTYYEAPRAQYQPSTTGWSLNAVQNLSDTWAIFGRANNTAQASGGTRQSLAAGVAMNNPLGRSANDQIAIAVGYNNQQKLPLHSLNLPAENIVEAYWNWTLFGGMLLTPDVQYIRNPVFAPTRDSVWVFSLRTTLLF